MTLPLTEGGLLYSSPRVYPFQARHVAEAYGRPLGTIARWDTGLGKTHFAMMLAAILLEDDLIDNVVVVCEKSVVKDWVGAFRVYTKIDVKKYHGLPPKRRREVAQDLPQCIVSTYETIREDVASRIKGRQRALQPDFLLEGLLGKRVLVVYDEMAKLKNRSSGIYKHHEFMVRQLRKKAQVRVIGLTATPMERDPENLLNQARLIDPKVMTIKEFEYRYITGFDMGGRPYGFKNLGEGDRVNYDFPTLAESLRHLVLHKSKFDDDVVAEFPTQIESFEHVDMEVGQRRLYDAVLKAVSEVDGTENEVPALNVQMSLRQIASYPEALALSDGQFARYLTGSITREGLKDLGSGKMVRLLEKLNQLVREEGLKVVVFTWFGQSVLPLIARDLRFEGYEVAINTGGMTSNEMNEQRDWFRKGSAQILLSSDAGSRGVNLPEAGWVVNFELPQLHAIYEQRINRNHRINSERSQVWAHSFIASGTLEEGIAESVLRKNDWFDKFLEVEFAGGQTQYRPTAVERRALVQSSKAK